jgi:Mor family transcriptional regulator
MPTPDGLWHVTHVPEIPLFFDERKRNSIPAERWSELQLDRQHGMSIKDLMAKYGVSRNYVFVILRRLRDAA